jgi:hypothetical protein
MALATIAIEPKRRAARDHSGGDLPEEMDREDCCWGWIDVARAGAELPVSAVAVENDEAPHEW